MRRALLFGFGVSASEETIGVTVSRRSAGRMGRTVWSVLAVTTLVALMAAPAVAAPSLGVEIVRDRDSVTRSDARLDYTVTVTNTATAPASVSVGDRLSCAGAEPPKNWGPNAAEPSQSFEWWRNGVRIPGETGVSYTTTGSDAGAVVQCLVYGTNANATTVFASLPGLVVDPQPATAPPVPASATVNASRPSVSGSGSATRTCNTGSLNWSGAPDYSFQWLRNGVEISGAITDTYIPDAGSGGADVGKVLQCRVVGTNVGGSLVGVSNGSAVSVSNSPSLNANNTPEVFAEALAGPLTLEVELPAGDETYVFATSTDFWSCQRIPADADRPARAVCTRPAVDVRAPGASYPPLNVAVALGSDGPDDAVATATAFGGGAAGSAVDTDQFTFDPFVPFGLSLFEAGVFDSVDVNFSNLDDLGADFTQAGGHPPVGAGRLVFNQRRNLNSGPTPDRTDQVPVGHLKELFTELPPGFVGNVAAIPELCESLDQVPVPSTCPPASAIGAADLSFTDAAGLFPIFAMEPERGAPAQFALQDPFKNIYTITPRLRPEDGYAVTLEVSPSPTLDFLQAEAVLCGFGPTFGGIGSGDFTDCKQAGDSGALETPLLSNPPACGDGPPVTVARLNSWEEPGHFVEVPFVNAVLTGCDQVSFAPLIDFDPATGVADAPTGLDVQLSLPTDGLEDPTGIAEAHLKGAEVTLPEGMTVNASSADGLGACSSDQVGIDPDTGVPDDEPVRCPAASKVATATVTTPVLDEVFEGSVYLARQFDNPFDSLLALYLVVESEERGIRVKIAGEVTPDAQTGRLTSVFDENPQLPLEDVVLHFKGGPRAPVKTPARCGSYGIESVLSSWSAPFTPDVSSTSSFAVDQGCGQENAFAPGFSAGSTAPVAGSFSPFVARVTRSTGKELGSIDMSLPQGSLAALKHVQLCSEGQLAASESRSGRATQAASACPVASQIGTVTAGAGAGPLYYPKIPGTDVTGRVFLTGPHKNTRLSVPGARQAAYGLAIEVPAVAGPFDLGTVLVRAAIFVDPTTAQITVRSEKMPRILEGIPLDVRDVRVHIDRPNFSTTPTSCAEKRVGADIHAQDGTTVAKRFRYQVGECADVRFRPRLAMRLVGRRQARTGGHPAVRALVRQSGIGEAGVRKARVALPRSLALDPDNAQALCEFEDGTKPDLENHCPKGSIVGRARAISPLLKRPLVGNVFFVKNIRVDEETGNEIRTLPMIVVALRGEVAVNLRGESSTTDKGKLVNTFANVPDAPISRFNLNIKGGRNGILTVTRTRRSTINLCTAGRQIARTGWRGQNGKLSRYGVRVKTPCRSAKRKRLRLRKQRAAAQRRAAARRDS